MRSSPSILVTPKHSLRAAKFSLAFVLLLALAIVAASLQGTPGTTVSAKAQATPTPCANQVYSNNFETSVGSEWSINRAEVTPTGNRRFLGQFGNDTVSLSLSALPQHTQVTVAFDLYVIRTWDGNGPAAEYGPDVFQAGVDGGATLTRTTFTNHSYLRQGYPDEFPAGNNAPRTGAVENNTLGYTFNGTPFSSVYRIEKTIAHTGGALKLNFSASGLEALDNESWGLDNVSVVVNCPPPPVCGSQIYSNNFENGAGTEWSTKETQTTPIGGRKFLGQFSNQTTSLSLGNLPAHTQVTVSFDVYVIRSWDGNSIPWGPDIFDVRAENGSVVTRTTFSLQPLWRQSYPAEYPGGDDVPGAGAAERNTLGYIFDGELKDAVFRITKTIDHTGGSLKLNFSASGLEILDNESWGLDNVAVAVNCPPVACNGDVYSNNFESAVGSEWSTNRAEVTPTGNRRFLGQFANETASLTLANLPQHTQVTVSFDVYVIRSWDGNSIEWGPDIFDVRAENGPVVTRTTFALQPLRQAFPSEFPGGDNAPATGAAEQGTLGYNFFGTPLDAVFRVTKTIQHTGSGLKLNFSASGLEAITNESWGLDNVKITVNCPAAAGTIETEGNSENIASNLLRTSTRDLAMAGNRRGYFR